MNVLIVEDNKPVGLVLARVVRELGLGAIMAPDGEGALRMFRQREVHLAIVDVQLPGRDGFSVTRAIRDDVGSSLPIILISANIDKGTQQQAGQAGADEFLAKPVRPGRLAELLRQYLPLPVTEPGTP